MKEDEFKDYFLVNLLQKGPNAVMNVKHGIKNV